MSRSDDILTLIQSHADYNSVADRPDTNTLFAWAVTPSITVDRVTVPVEDVYNAIVSSEHDVLSEADQNKIYQLMAIHLFSGVRTASGTRARSELVATYGAGSDTVQALSGLITHDVSPADNAGIIGLTEGEVEFAYGLDV